MIYGWFLTWQSSVFIIFSRGLIMLTTSRRCHRWRLLLSDSIKLNTYKARINKNAAEMVKLILCLDCNRLNYKEEGILRECVCVCVLLSEPISGMTVPCFIIAHKLKVSWGRWTTLAPMQRLANLSRSTSSYSISAPTGLTHTHTHCCTQKSSALILIL